MKKYILYACLVIHVVYINNLLACPCEFSSEDERPFFEQYEIEIKTSSSQEKEKKS